MFLVRSLYFNLRNILPKSGTFLLGHIECSFIWNSYNWVPYDYLSCVFTITMPSVPTQICSRGWAWLQKSHIFHPLKVMFCHWVELIQDAALHVFVVGEVWKVLCQHDGAYAHFSRDAIGSHKRTFWSHLDWPYFLPCMFFRLNAPAFLSMGPCWSVLCLKCPWKPKVKIFSGFDYIRNMLWVSWEDSSNRWENIQCVWQYPVHALGILRGF